MEVLWLRGKLIVRLVGGSVDLAFCEGIVTEVLGVVVQWETIDEFVGGFGTFRVF